jgi:SpoVK/Ycf46/Vps4 family AAA+-type ATPase
MDDRSLQSLRDALRATPGNPRLLLVLLAELLERGGADEAYALLQAQVTLELETVSDQCLVAGVCLAAGRPDEALLYCRGDDPKGLLLQSRAHLALGDIHQAEQAYESAVTQRPELADAQLMRALQAGDARVPSISRDDTTAGDVDRLLVPTLGRVTFDDVGGLDEVKQQIHRKIVLPFRDPGLFARFRRRAGGGILLYGPPGCGKTLLARATAGECKAAFLNVAISDVLDMYIGESEQKLHAIFERARRLAPSVLFFDEIEALGGRRQFTREATSSKLVSQFLSEMDGFMTRNLGVLVLGATNVPWAVDAAFRRPGRFDRVLFVPPPDRPARQRILELLLADLPVDATLDAGRWAQRTSSYSGADLRSLIETAADVAIEDSLAAGSDVPIADRHLDRAHAEVKPTTLEWLTTARNYARYANEGGQYDEVLAFLAQHGKS